MVDRERTAFHEAGHAVASVLRGIPIDSVSIEARDHVDWAGRCLTADPRINDIYGEEVDEDEVYRDHLLVTLAGPIAVSIYTSEPWDLGSPANGSDRDAILDLALKLFESPPGPDGVIDASKPVDACAASVTEMLQDNWPAVKRVTFALLQHGTIGGDQVREIVDEG